ncbi:MAG TPA: hypothetical protein VFF67_03885 [Thermoplasmata archaeon]|nr:hypothetical protein [Thermoplasmata archaeon]
MNGREPAWRTLALELNAATEEERGEGDRAASYLVSPMGGRMSRVLLAGTLAPAEPSGRPDGPPFLRARLADPTGTITVTAGGFQPRALAALQAHRAPSAHVAVGKVSLFQGRDGNSYVSVRAEGLRAIDPVTYRGFLSDTVKQTVRRIELVQKLRLQPSTPDEELAASGVPSAWLRGARTSIARFPSVEPSRFVGPLATALAVVQRGEPKATPAASIPSPSVTVTRRAPPAAPPPPSAAEQALAASFLDVVDGLADASVDGYADLRDAFRLAAERGVNSERAEELLNRLEEDGVLEEPIVGKLRRA